VPPPWAAPSLWQRAEKPTACTTRPTPASLLQQPAEALAPLPRDTAGNLVQLGAGHRQRRHRAAHQPAARDQVRVRDDDIIVSRFGSMPAVKFPHRQHTLWLDCSNCHDTLFKSKAGANRFSMVAILNGEQCGLCHGAVAFPLTECNRCHSVPNASLRKPVRCRRHGASGAASGFARHEGAPCWR
jgi:c(7)-type cytochrome triheme protein